MRGLIQRLRRLRPRRVAVASTLVAAAAVAVCLSPASPAGATLWYDAQWHAGRGEFSWYSGAGPQCTSGPQYYSWTNNRIMMAMPRHCFEVSYNDGTFGTPAGAGFASKWENSNNNKFDGGQVGFRTNPAYPANIDIVIIDIGTPTAVSRSRYQFNYCNPFQNWNCSSYAGGGSANNANWVGFYNRVVANGWPSPGLYMCKHGAVGGTACGVTDISFTTSNQGYSTPITTVKNVGQCGHTGGDSGAPVLAPPVARALSQDVTGMGMATVGVGLSFNSGAGNSCYGPNRPYWDWFGGPTDDTIRGAFSAFGLQLLQWD